MLGLQRKNQQHEVRGHERDGWHAMTISAITIRTGTPLFKLSRAKLETDIAVLLAEPER